MTRVLEISPVTLCALALRTRASRGRSGTVVCRPARRGTRVTAMAAPIGTVPAPPGYVRGAGARLGAAA